MDVQPIKTVIIGLGRAGWDIHWKMLKDHRGFQVVAAVEPVAARRHEAEDAIGCRTFSSLAQFLAHPEAELAVIATPSGGHGPEGLACLDAGLHTVIDKPMCQGVAEADALIARSRSAGRLLTCYHPYRFSPRLLALVEIVRSGKLGRLVEIDCNMSSFTRRNDWVMRKARGGGLHNVWGSHIIDQCLQLAASAPRDVFADLQCTVTPGDADDHCRIVVRCENGTLIDAQVSNCMAFPLSPEWRLAGVCGGAVVEGQTVRLKYFDPREAPPLSIVDGPAVGRRYGNDDALPWREEVIPFDATENLSVFYDNVHDTIRHGAAPAITPESVRDTIVVLELCRRQNPHVWAGVEGESAP